MTRKLAWLTRAFAGLLQRRPAAMEPAGLVVGAVRDHRARFGDRVFSDSGLLVREMRDERSGLR